MSRGPQPKYVRDDTGREVHGLCQEKVARNGAVHYRYYSWYTDGRKRRKKHHGGSNNKVAAIFAFRQWEARQQEELIEFRIPAKILVGDHVVTSKPGQEGIDIAVLQDVLQAEELFTLTAGRQVKLPADLVWKKIGQIIMGDPRLAAQRMGIPELARLHTLPIPTEPLALAEIREAYLTQKSFKYARQKYDAQSAWDRFAKTVGCATIDQITPTDIARYHKSISGKGYAARTVKNLIRTIQAFLNHAAAIHKPHRPQLLELKQDIRTICRIPKQKEPSPKPMDKDDYLTLLGAVKRDKKWYAMLLTALNLALHGTELAEVQTSEINLRAGEFSTHRTKTGVARVAKLWDRTVEAIKAYQATDHFKKNRTKLLFTEAPKLLLTATPLQNSLLELFSLVSVIDPHVFSDIASFREQFVNNGDEVTRNVQLKQRIAPVCTRALRKQVIEYIPFTNRVPITQEFLPTDQEQALYDEITTYLQREVLYALPASQRQLITMVLRKLLASSTFAIARKLPVAEVTFDYTNHPSKISVIEPLVGQSGWLEVSRLTVSAVEVDEFLVFAARTDHNQVLDEEICGKLFSLPATLGSEIAEVSDLTEPRKAEVAARLGEIDTRNARFFDEEVLKLDRWSEDLKLSLEHEIKALDKQIRELRRSAALAQSLQDKLNHQKQLRDLERRRNVKRRELFDAQDAIDQQREDLIGKIEKQLKHTSTVQTLFTIRWSVR